jgi:predicted glutamine amidotransferase
LFLSVWYTTGKTYGRHDDEWKMIGGPAEAGGSILISSEPLTRDTSTWFEVPEYSAIIAANGAGNQQPRVKFLEV